jgi:hypothetical protein
LDGPDRSNVESLTCTSFNSAKMGQIHWKGQICKMSQLSVWLVSRIILVLLVRNYEIVWLDQIGYMSQIGKGSCKKNVIFGTL